jgi:hypothetical protein
MIHSVDAFDSRPVRLGASMLAALLLAGPVAPHMAHAQVSGCMADPVVSLSNGTQLDLFASIDDSSQDVQQVTFEVHVPRGVQEVAYTPGLLGPKQVVNVYSDRGPRSYITRTLVTTQASGVQVTATTRAVGISRTVLASGSHSGHAGQWITVPVTL